MARFFDGERAAAHDVTPQLTKDELLLRTADGSVLAAWPIGHIVAVERRIRMAPSRWRGMVSRRG